MTAHKAEAATNDPCAVIETQVAVMVRNSELFRRRSDFEGTLDRAGYLLLIALDALGPSDIGTLAGALGLDPSTVGRQVGAAESKGLVTRHPDERDRRRSIVSPSADGAAAMTDLHEARRRRFRDLLADWSEEDRVLLATMFTRYNDVVARAYLAGLDHRPAAPE